MEFDGFGGIYGLAPFYSSPGLGTYLVSSEKVGKVERKRRLRVAPKDVRCKRVWRDPVESKTGREHD